MRSRMSSLTSHQRFIGVALCSLVPLLFVRAVLKGKREETTHRDGTEYVLITGCDSGLGASLARRARDAGFRVIVACYTEEGARRYEGCSGISTVVADLTTEGGIEAVANAAKLAAGRKGLYALVNNAGLCLPGDVDWVPPISYRRSMDLNFHAPVSLTYELLPAIKVAGGRVVNVTSQGGILSLPSHATYCSSKFALESFSDSLRCEMLPWGVKVVVIEPSGVKTPLSKAWPESWLQGFKDAAEERRAPYGNAWAEKTYSKIKKLSGTILEDPSIAVEAMMEALTHANPRSRILAGKAGGLVTLSRFPDKIRDSLLYRMFGPDEPPPALMK